MYCKLELEQVCELLLSDKIIEQWAKSMNKKAQLVYHVNIISNKRKFNVLNKI